MEGEVKSGSRINRVSQLNALDWEAVVEASNESYVITSFGKAV